MYKNKDMVLIDICGTLFDSNTTFDFLDYVFKNNKRYRIERKISSLFLIKKANSMVFRILKFDFKRFYFIKYLKGFSKDELALKVKEFYDYVLINKINRKVWNAIEDIRGTKILVSATLDIIAEEIAQRLGIKSFLSSKLEYKDDLCIGTLTEDLLNKKKEALKKNGIESPYYTVVSNDFTDMQLFRSSQHNFIVTKYKQYRLWEKKIEKNNLKDPKILCID